MSDQHESAQRYAQLQEILELGRALQDAWNRGDAAGYASLFTEDADFVAWTGTYGRGRQNIEDAHRKLFAGPLAGSRMNLINDDPDVAPPDIRFIRPDVAIAVVSSAVTPAGWDGTNPDHVSVQTFVLAKENDQWRIAAFHNTRA